MPRIPTPALTTAVALLAVSSTCAAAALLQGPVVGGVTGESARVWVRADAGAEFAVRYGRRGDLADAAVSEPARGAPDADGTAVVELDGLLPGTTYVYCPLVDGVAALDPPFPVFTTAPAGDAEFDFVVLTDFEDPRRGGRPTVFAAAAAERPEFVILGGDLDHRNPGLLAAGEERDAATTLESMRAMRRENFDRSLERREDFVDLILRRGAVADLWDDHDFCCNDADGGFDAKDLALRVYDEYFPGYDRPAPGEGIYQTWRWGQVQFFLLDGRYHRSPSAAPDDEDKTMLGAEQKAWLERELASSTAVWKVLLSGSVFNPTVKCGADNWCEYRTEGRELVDFVREHDIRNVVVLSGDIHAGGITDGTNSVYDTFWEMASPAADNERPGCDTTRVGARSHLGQWSVGAWDGSEPGRRRTVRRTCFGYGLVRVRTDPHHLELAVKDAEGATVVEAVVPDER